MMYNPFNKNISEIEYDDLKKLKDNDVSEGWFIEYKESFPKNNKKIANSIASFANSEGGWYIVGIKENDNESKPSEIIGFDLNCYKKPADKITNIVKDNIDPIPYFESKIIEIPGEKVVLVVQIFEGQDAPYISNGSIYIRVGETSKPLPINDRYQFEKLLNKKEKFQKNVNSFMKNSFFFNKNYNQPYLEVYIYINNPKVILFENFYSEEFFETLKYKFKSKTKIIEEINLSTSFTFDNIHSSVDSYILRQIYDNNPLDTGLILELFKEGHLKLILPFNIYTNITLNNKYNSLIYYDYFISEELRDLRIIDLVESIYTLQVILSKYKELLKEYKCEYELNIKCKFNNFNSITPFIDSKKYIKFIYENKLPINLKTTLTIPNNGYLKIPFDDFNVMKFTTIMIEATGLPRHLISVISESYWEFLKHLSKK